MIQKAFWLYWGYCHVATFVLLALLLSHRVWALRFPAAGSLIARVTSYDFGAIDKLLIVLAIAHCAFYLCLPNFADYTEPLIPLLASNYLHGAPVYADWHAGQTIVGSVYGPYVFLAQIPVLLWFPAIAASKLIGIGFALAALLMLFLAVRNRAGSQNDALVMCALMVALLSFQRHYWFWNRPDSILIALVAFGVLLFDRARPSVCLAGLGLLAGVAINLKIFGALYLLPLALACLPMVPSWSGLIGAFSIGGGLFAAALALPFEAGSFSLQNYIANIALVMHQGLVPVTIRTSLLYGLAILALPLLTWRALGASREERVMAIGLIVCMGVVAVVSGKPGGGTPYMMPLIPLSLYLTARLSRREGVASGSEITKTRRLVLCAVLIGAAPIWAYSWFEMAKQIPAYRTELAKAAELRSLLAAFPQSEMGHNSGPDSAKDEFFRVERAFLGQVTRFDYINVADQQLAGLDSSILYPLFENCSVPSWILSRQGGRFLGDVYGNGTRRLFDEGALQRFYANYELAQQFEFYEVWGCRKSSNAASAAGRPEK
jgi:hypothetical protein